MTWQPTDLETLANGEALDGAADVEHYRSERERLYAKWQRVVRDAENRRRLACNHLTTLLASDPAWSIARATELAHEADALDEEAEGVAKAMREWSRR